MYMNSGARARAFVRAWQQTAPEFDLSHAQKTRCDVAGMFVCALCMVGGREREKKAEKGNEEEAGGNAL